MFTQTIHHTITIHLEYMQSPTLEIYSVTDNITINQHICIHQPYYNQTTYMYSPTISQSINIYVFTHNITINQHICIHQHRFYHIIQQHHIISHNSSEEKIHHTKISIIFNTQQSFTYLYIIISNYQQKICHVFGLKDHFQQSLSIILQL